MKLVNSFIFSFKKNRKNILEVLLTIVCCFLVGELVNYVLVGNVNDADHLRGPSAMFERKILNSFYQHEENIDNLYVGSSHVYCDIIPEQLDEINGKNNFNITSPGQPYIASYYLLKRYANLMICLMYIWRCIIGFRRSMGITITSMY